MLPSHGSYSGSRKKLSWINDSLSADCALSELRFPFKISPVVENRHSSSTDDALLVSTIFATRFK